MLRASEARSSARRAESAPDAESSPACCSATISARRFTAWALVLPRKPWRSAAAAKHPIEEILEACEVFSMATGRRVLVEYVLLADVNMGRKAAREVAHIARRLGGKVNLIEYNPNPGLPFKPPSRVETHAFRAELEAKGVKVTIRFRRGRKIAAGCGQLAAEAQPRAEAGSGPMT